ncbi:hypothetical protein [Methylobacterium sp. JK268]
MFRSVIVGLAVLGLGLLAAEPAWARGFHGGRAGYGARLGGWGASRHGGPPRFGGSHGGGYGRHPGAGGRTWHPFGDRGEGRRFGQAGGEGRGGGFPSGPDYRPGRGHPGPDYVPGAAQRSRHDVFPGGRRPITPRYRPFGARDLTI